MDTNYLLDKGIDNQIKLIDQLVAAIKTIEEQEAEIKTLREQLAQQPIQLHCFSCSKPVSTPVPSGVVIRAIIQCPECIEKEG